MLSYSIRRLLTLIPMLLVISFLIFLGMELMPGDAVSYMVSPDQLANLSPEQLEACLLYTSGSARSSPP